MRRTHALTISLPILLLAGVLFLSPISAHALTLTPVRLEISGNAGDTLSQEMTLINERDTAETYYVSYANFEAQGETGSPTYVDAHDDLGTWMSAPESVFLAPGASKIVPIKITIPKDADAGGHFAVIFWGTAPNKVAPGEVAIGSKTGMLVLLRVNGDVTENGGILEFGTKNAQKLYTSLPVNFSYRFQNSGGDRVKPAGTVIIKDMIGLTATKIPGNPVEGNILPASVRRFETAWSGRDGAIPVEEKDAGNFFTKAGREWHNFAFGRYRATMTLAYGTKNQTTTGTTVFWVLPWHLSLLIIVLLLLAFFVGRTLIRRYNHWVISRAEELLAEREAHHAAHKKK